MNRAPGKTDTWWARHQDECGGAFVKIAEPELSKDQVERLSGLKRAGRQKNKIDAWVEGRRETKAKRGPLTQEVEELNEPKKRRELSPPCLPAKRPKAIVSCPICEADIAEDSINEHLDVHHPP
ncbi:hypothetical protein KC318_g5637 [Hortaea werneckii]|nr:hypothetical protein KC318_g5637 [Hortaea werneckii]